MRLGTDICEKSGEVMTPFVTYSNATSAPMPVISTLRVMAALHHVNPGMKLWRDPTLFGMSVTQRMCVAPFGTPTTTAFGVTRTQVLAFDNSYLSTITSALPHRSSALILCAFYHDKTTISLTS